MDSTSPLVRSVSMPEPVSIRRTACSRNWCPSSCTPLARNHAPVRQQVVSRMNSANVPTAAMIMAVPSEVRTA